MSPDSTIASAMVNGLRHRSRARGALDHLPASGVYSEMKPSLSATSESTSPPARTRLREAASSPPWRVQVSAASVRDPDV